MYGKMCQKNMFSLAAQATSLNKIGLVTILVVYSTKSWNSLFETTWKKTALFHPSKSFSGGWLWMFEICISDHSDTNCDNFLPCTEAHITMV